MPALNITEFYGDYRRVLSRLQNFTGDYRVLLRLQEYTVEITGDHIYMGKIS